MKMKNFKERASIRRRKIIKNKKWLTIFIYFNKHQEFSEQKPLELSKGACRPILKEEEIQALYNYYRESYKSRLKGDVILHL
jgi:hypothetical protein